MKISCQSVVVSRKSFGIKLIPLLLLLFGCNSINLPTIEQSQKLIGEYKPLIEQNDNKINTKIVNLPSGDDAILNVNITALNKILQTFASSRNDDIYLYFGYSPGMVREDKSVFGIKYSNYINIDSGKISVNLKSFKFNSFEQNKINANIEIEGFGKIAVSGKYMAIPASVSPDVQLYLNEPVTFLMMPANNGNMILSPMSKKLTLKVKISVKLLQWSVPWYQEIPLELTDLMKPITIPLSLQSEIQFPLPAAKPGEQKIESVPYWLDFKNSSFTGANGKIIYKTDINFIKK